MKNIVLFLLAILPNTVFVNAYVEIPIPDSKYALDLNLFEDVLDPELCESQMTYIMNNDTELLLNFFDSGIRTPRGILTGNTLDLGNYYQCLGINKRIPNSVVEGKYCMIQLPLNQHIKWPESPILPDIPLPDFPWTELNPNTRRLSDSMIKRLTHYHRIKSGIDTIGGGHIDTRIYSANENFTLPDITFNLAVCLPKVCSTKSALGSFINITELGVQYNEQFCRLPNDKAWRAGDYVAIAIFSLIGLLAVLSTAYDLRYNIFLQKDPKKINKLYQSFSVYNNTTRLVTYVPVPNAIECLDGIRAFAMMWVILGHTFVNQVSSNIMANPLDALEWMMSLSSIWITAGPITVDTFFMLSGLLLVYTTNGKVKPMNLLRNLHLFYLNRILRILPVLCAMILIQISFLNWIVDGPFWLVNMDHVHKCRVYWWGTLLHIQNIHSPSTMCLPHSWYLAIDMQLHILSPIVLFWVLTGRRRVAWTALVGSLIAILTASTVFNFIRNFPSAVVSPSRPQDSSDYMFYYYVNTLTRASPFFVGLIFGYLLSIYRGRKNVNLSRITATFLWTCALAIGCLTVYSSYPIMQFDWDNQVADNMINSFMRPAWGAAVGWLIFACVHGYGGPVNWLLSHRMWKILGRLSYAMYVTHYPLIFMVNAMPVAPVFFNVPFSLLKFLTDFSLAVIVSFIITILVDSPFSVLIKHFLGGGVKKTPVKLDSKDQGQSPVINGKRKELAP